MTSSIHPPSVLVVCDPDDAAAFTEPLRQPMSSGAPQLWVASTDGQAEALYAQHCCEVLVIAATRRQGDAAELIAKVRAAVGRAEVSVVVVGDLVGPVTSALDAAELGGDRFVARPLAAKALRYAVAVSIDAARLARGGRVSPGTPVEVHDDPTDGYRQAQRARWARLADSIIDGIRADDLAEVEAPDEDAPPSLVIQPRRHITAPIPKLVSAAAPGESTAPLLTEPWGAEQLAAEGAHEEDAGPSVNAELSQDAARSRRALAEDDHADDRDPIDAGGDALDDDFGDELSDEFVDAFDDDAQPTPGLRGPARRNSAPAIEDLSGRVLSVASLAALVGMPAARAPAGARPAASGPAEPVAPPSVSTPLLRPSPLPAPATPPMVSDRSSEAAAASNLEDAVWSAPELLAQLHEATLHTAPPVTPPVVAQPPGGREFARQLRQKMSAMAQRLFAHQGQGATALDAAPQHDHQIEFDLAALVDEPALSEGPEIIGLHTSVTPVFRETQPGTWDGGARELSERHLPDSGEILRGASDAPAIVVRMWALSATGRVAFRRGETEKFVFFDQGRPVFASSTELHDRMGELLYREGKITHAQYMHSKSLVAESGRRMGEILVDLGYLKHRELYPAVRRHVEDIIYSLFAWDHGTYRITLETTATTERIRLARRPEAVVLEGIRRKLDRAVLERLVGPPSTVLELKDRERLAGLATAIELSHEERAVLAAIDGQADLPAIARAAGIPIAAVLPLAWALIVLGYASARRDHADPGEEPAVAGEIDLAIDRERVRARWQLVAEADYFTLLGVRRDATSFEIRRAYEASRRDFAGEGFPPELRRELAREGLDDIATVLDEAYRVLRDDPLRREYLAHLVD